MDDIDSSREEVHAFEPRKGHALLIGLFGRTGCGKTSLINSLKFAVSGRLRRAKWLQVAAQGKAGGHTMFRKLTDLTESISVVDNRGLDNPNTEEAVKELHAQLGGERGFSEKVEWQERDDPQPVKCDALSGQPIGCAVLVFSALHDIEASIRGLDVLVETLYKYQGRYPICVITHVDVAPTEDTRELKNWLWYAGLTDVFDVANLTAEKLLLEALYQCSLLSFLKRCIAYGDEGVARAEARGCERGRGGRHPRYENDHQHERQRRDVGEERGIQELRDKVAAYRPRREDNIYIGLFGRTGCGKTSLINSLKFAVSGRLRRAKWLQVAAQEKAGGHTMFRRLADITPSIYVIDNRGLDDPATPIAVTELDEQLSGERGYSHQIQWQERDSVEPAPRDHRSRHRISCAVLVFSSLAVGLLLTGTSQTIVRWGVTMIVTNYRVAFLAFAGIASLATFSSIFMDYEYSTCDWETQWTELRRVLLSGHFASVFFVAFFTGACNGCVWGFLLWHFQNLGASNTLIGVLEALQSVSELGLGYFSRRLLHSIGHIAALTLGLGVYTFRFVCYASITNPLWLIPVEVIHGFNFLLTWTTLVSYMGSAVPAECMTTVQGILGALYFGLGIGVGSLASGILIDHVGAVVTFYGSAVACFTVMIFFILLQKLLPHDIPIIAKGAAEVDDEEKQLPDDFSDTELEDILVTASPLVPVRVPVKHYTQQLDAHHAHSAVEKALVRHYLPYHYHKYRHSARPLSFDGRECCSPEHARINLMTSCQRERLLSTHDCPAYAANASLLTAVPLLENAKAGFYDNKTAALNLAGSEKPSYLLVPRTRTYTIH